MYLHTLFLLKAFVSLTNTSIKITDILYNSVDNICTTFELKLINQTVT